MDLPPNFLCCVDDPNERQSTGLFSGIINPLPDHRQVSLLYPSIAVYRYSYKRDAKPKAKRE
jgi:hypothetical protein